MRGLILAFTSCLLSYSSFLPAQSLEMNFREYAKLCNGPKYSESCLFYTRGLVDGIVDGLPYQKETLKIFGLDGNKRKTTLAEESSTVFVLTNSLSAIGACREYNDYSQLVAPREAVTYLLNSISEISEVATDKELFERSSINSVVVGLIVNKIKESCEKG